MENQNKKIEKAAGTTRNVISFIRANRGRSWFTAALAAVVTVVILLLSAISASESNTVDTTLSTFKVRRDDLTITVTQNGSLKAREAVDIISTVEGSIPIISIVPEGTYITEEDVKNGKILVELDSSSYIEDVAQREIDFASAEASFAEANEAYIIQIKQNESDITAAELKVQFAMMDFQKYLGETVARRFIDAAKSGAEIGSLSIDPNALLDDAELGGAASQRLKELEDNIVLAEAKLKRAQDQLRGTQKLFDNKYVSQTELAADTLDVNSLEIQEKRVRTDLELFKLYEFRKQGVQYLSDWKESERELDRTVARARSRLAQANAKLKSEQARYYLRKNRLDDQKKQIAGCIMRAPTPGLVVYSSSSDQFQSRREGPIQAGTSVRQRQVIMSLPNTAEMVVEVAVHESSVVKVKPNQQAKIIIDAFPDNSFTGKVLKVALLPDQQRGWLSPDLKVYKTDVTIDGNHSYLKPGMSAKVEIVVDELSHVLIVPVQVVASRGGKRVCYVVTPGGVKEREVQTGAFSDTFVEIVKGLEEGEVVLMNPPQIAEEKASINSKKPAKPGNTLGAEQPAQTVESQSQPPQQENVQTPAQSPEQSGTEEGGQTRQRPSGQFQGRRRQGGQEGQSLEQSSSQGEGGEQSWRGRRGEAGEQNLSGEQSEGQSAPADGQPRRRPPGGFGGQRRQRGEQSALGEPNAG